VGIGYVAGLFGAILTSLLLGLALWAKSGERPSVLLVSANDDPKVVTPGIVPDALARDFARDFVVTLENYLPTTLAKSLAFLETRIAPQGFHEFERLTTGLKKLVKESKQSSQLIADDPASARVLRDGRRIEVILGATRRIFVEGALLQEARVNYRFALVSGEPSRGNPTGLLVSGFSVKLQDREDSRGK
jgi:hypothetical protein